MHWLPNIWPVPPMLDICHFCISAKCTFFFRLNAKNCPFYTTLFSLFVFKISFTDKSVFLGLSPHFLYSFYEAFYFGIFALLFAISSISGISVGLPGCADWGYLIDLSVRGLLWYVTTRFPGHTMLKLISPADSINVWWWWINLQSMSFESLIFKEKKRPQVNYAYAYTNDAHLTRTRHL